MRFFPLFSAPLSLSLLPRLSLTLAALEVAALRFSHAHAQSTCGTRGYGKNHARTERVYVCNVL